MAQKKEQTAVDFLVNKFAKYYAIHQLQDEIDKALQMFERQIIDAHIEGFYSPPFGKGRNGEAQEYFNKTFKKK